MFLIFRFPVIYFVLHFRLCFRVFFSPDGRRVKNKAQLARILGSKFDLAGFDFRTGRMTGGVHRRMCLLSLLYSFHGYPT